MVFLCCFIRSKNFEKGSDYNKTWKANDDGKVNTNGPRVVVGDPNGPMISGNYCTK
jgi:synaptosomal-associated protein 25